ARHTKAVSVEIAAELCPAWFSGVRTVGVTAGASTPSSIIEEVLSSMSDEIREEELSFEEMINASMKPIFAGQTVKGIVTAISPSEIQVDIGVKQTGFVKLEELTNDPTAKAEDVVKKGDELDLMVTSVKDQDGIVYLSKRRLDENKGKEEVAAAVDSGEVMEGYVTEFNSGGVVALVNNVRVFVPRSQATLRHGEDYTQLVKQTVKLKIKQCEGRHIVGSIREVLAGAADVAREKFWQDVEVGKQYAGIVKSLTSYGAFVDIGGVDGLVHISELSWNRIKHPSEVVNVGDTIDVYVKDIDSENKKVSLGYKKVEDNPWEKLKSEYPIGSTFTAPVVSITKFGAFVRILPGVDGLVHISEISHDRVEKVSDVLSVGQEVEVKLTDVDFDKKRISLSMKALLPETEASEDAAEAADTAPEAADAVETEESTEA
ncbi:MAG: S1 RNA-binding domain-containing protein, partial [Ruthenibacterium sp.]